MQGFEIFILANYEVLETTGRDEIRINCPACDDTKFHHYVNVKKGVTFCFRCHGSASGSAKGWSAYQFLYEFHSLDHTEIFHILRGDDDGAKHRIRLPEGETVSDSIKGVQQAVENAVSGFTPSDTEEVELPPSYSIFGSSLSCTMAFKYLVGRLGRERTNFYGKKLGFRVCTNGQYARRIILPVLDHETKSPIFFQGRAFLPPNANPPYLNPPVERKLFFPYRVRKGEVIILVEGYFDALAVGKGAAAVFGSSLTRHQLLTLSTLEPKTIIISFDDDNAGRSGAAIVCKELVCITPEVKIVRELGGSDPAELGYEAKKVILSQAEKYRYLHDMQPSLLENV